MGIWDFLKNLTDPASIMEYGGLALLLFVVFAETGLLVGFFLPGDSLIFISGMFCSTRPELLGVNIVVLLMLMTASAVLGNMAGYWFGKKVGPGLFRREDSLIFKKRYLETTREFYGKHGARAIILGRFLPIIRTFAPILAGVTEMPFRQFMLYNVIGGTVWIGALGSCGFFLGRIKWVEENIGYIIIGFIVITTIPVARTWIRGKRKKAGGAEEK